MRILLLNQFVPPAQPPTAKLIGDLAEAFRQAGHVVEVVGSGGGYGPARGVKRLWRDLQAHRKIAWSVCKAGRCDWIVALTDPTGLPATARLLSSLTGASLAHWAMDVYPQTAVALGAIKEGFASRMVGNAMRFGYRGCRLLVALDDDMKSVLSSGTTQPVQVLPPWPPDASPVASLPARSGRRRWLYSGNLGRAHDYETMLSAQQILETSGADWELHIQGGGSARQEAHEMAQRLGLKNCFWNDYVPEAELLPALMRADALVATQRPETRGLLWPSKLSVMKHLGLPLVWVGPENGAVAQWLRRQEVESGIFIPGAAADLAQWLQSRDRVDRRLAPAAVADSIRNERQAGTRWWIQQLGSLRA